eukprot:gene14121-15206_t
MYTRVHRFAPKRTAAVRGAGWFEFRYQLGGRAGYEALGAAARPKGGLYSFSAGAEANVTVDAEHATAADVDCPLPAACRCDARLLRTVRLRPGAGAAARRCVVRFRNAPLRATAPEGAPGEGAPPAAPGAAFKLIGVNVRAAAPDPADP